MFGSGNLADEMYKLSIDSLRKNITGDLTGLVAAVKKYIKMTAVSGRMWVCLYSCDEITDWVENRGYIYFNPKSYNLKVLKSEFTNCGFTVKKESDCEDFNVILTITWKR